MRHEANEPPEIDAFDESKSLLRMSLSDLCLQFRLLRANECEFFPNRDKFSNTICDRLKIQKLNSNKLNDK